MTIIRSSRSLLVPATLAVLAIAGCRSTSSCPHCGGHHRPHYHVVPNGSHVMPLHEPMHAPPASDAPAILPGGDVVPPAPASEQPILPAPGSTSQSTREMKSAGITRDRSGHLTASPIEPEPMTEPIGSTQTTSPDAGKAPTFFDRLQSGFREMVGPALQ